MVMGGCSKYLCFEHGEQTARGCVIECPVCRTIDFMKGPSARATPEEIKEFEDGGWKGSYADDPWKGGKFDDFDF